MMIGWTIVESVRKMDRWKKHLENKNHLGGGWTGKWYDGEESES